jgi:hypothetical protein
MQLLSIGNQKCTGVVACRYSGNLIEQDRKQVMEQVMEQDMEQVMEQVMEQDMSILWFKLRN